MAVKRDKARRQPEHDNDSGCTEAGCGQTGPAPRHLRQQDKRCGEQAERADDPECCRGRQQKQHADDAERTYASPDEVESVEPTNLVLVAGEGEPDRPAAKKERQHEKRIAEGQPDQLPRVPYDR